jgi:hypothetical protein
MKNSLRTALCVLSSVCLAAAVLVGCAQTGQERAQDYTQQNMLTQGYGTNNLVGARNYTGNRYTGNNLGTNLWGNTGTNNRTGNYTGINAGTNARTNVGNNVGMNSNNNGTQISAADRQKASAIKRQLLNMNGVNDAEVIVMGNDCLVGVMTPGAASSGQLKSAISRRVKQIDSTIQNVTVSDTSDVLARMRRLGSGTNTNYGTGVNDTNANGRNLMNNISDEFNKLMQKANNMTR